jgi:2-keto-4-pentenoate hydratase/2-oxohepta-3-ene-1,7-dioic acid hydratase in catechol pathway
MKLASFTHDGITRVGIVTGNEVIDTQQLTGIPELMTDFLAADLVSSETIRYLADTSIRRIALDEVVLEAPVLRPPKFFGIGLNYLDHIEETGRDRPATPAVFNKQSTCVIGTGAAIHRPRVSNQLDYEGELGIVIGKRCRHVPRERAWSVIAGYLVVNDVSVRDWQFRSPTWTLGKSFDTHGPIGPWIVTHDEIGDPHALDIKTWLNEELRQSSNTKNLLFDCYYLIEYLSTVFTLEPGDIISTGTSSGVGALMDPPGFMKPGDVVKIEIEKIGFISNPVIPEPGDTAFID